MPLSRFPSASLIILSQLHLPQSFIYLSLSLYWTTIQLTQTIILESYKNYKPCTEHSSTSCKTEILTFLLYWTKALAGKASNVCSQSLKYLLSVIVLSLCLVFCCYYFCSHCESSYPHVFFSVHPSICLYSISLVCSYFIYLIPSHSIVLICAYFPPPNHIYKIKIPRYDQK